MFRTLLISRGERISIQNNWLVVTNDKGDNSIPLEDIYCVVVDQQHGVISVAAIARLVDSGAMVIFCNEKHMPTGLLLPLNTHYRPYGVLKRQINLTEEFKASIWERIIKSKISNQARVLKLCNGRIEPVERLFELSNSIQYNDKNNCEAVASKMVFRALYGSSFIRQADDCINAALNYGYTIIRSAVARALTGYGFNCTLGIFHINEFNGFNLADDLMEPYRPIVDYWVSEHSHELINELEVDNKRALVNLLNEKISLDGRKLAVRNAIDLTASSLSSAIEKQNPIIIKLPEIHKLNWLCEDEGDE